MMQILPAKIQTTILALQNKHLLKEVFLHFTNLNKTEMILESIQVGVPLLIRVTFHVVIPSLKDQKDMCFQD